MERVPTNPWLLEAQQAFEEGKRLQEAGQYAAAIPRFERALDLRTTVLTGTHPQVADRGGQTMLAPSLC